MEDTAVAISKPLVTKTVFWVSKNNRNVLSKLKGPQRLCSLRGSCKSLLYFETSLAYDKLFWSISDITFFFYVRVSVDFTICSFISIQSNISKSQPCILKK